MVNFKIGICQHVISVEQKKILSPWQDLSLWPPEQQLGARSTELQRWRERPRYTRFTWHMSCFVRIALCWYTERWWDFKLGNKWLQYLALLLRKSLHRFESCHELKMFSLSNACDIVLIIAFFRIWSFCLNSMWSTRGRVCGMLFWGWTTVLQDHCDWPWS